MKSLTTLCLEKISGSNTIENIRDTALLFDSQTRYAEELGHRMRRKKEHHFFQLIRFYYAFYLNHDDQLNVAYDYVNITELPRWKLVQWCACEIAFGHYHTPEKVVWRIRLELPWENEHGRCLKYNIESFEKALAENCPNMKGSVHDWNRVFMHVPTKLLQYEEFFG